MPVKWPDPSAAAAAAAPGNAAGLGGGLKRSQGEAPKPSDTAGLLPKRPFFSLTVLNISGLLAEAILPGRQSLCLIGRHCLLR
jgi:hypothetical protein